MQNRDVSRISSLMGHGEFGGGGAARGSIDCLLTSPGSTPQISRYFPALKLQPYHVWLFVEPACDSLFLFPHSSESAFGFNSLVLLLPLLSFCIRLEIWSSLTFGPVSSAGSASVGSRSQDYCQRDFFLLWIVNQVLSASGRLKGAGRLKALSLCWYVNSEGASSSWRKCSRFQTPQTQ